MPKGPIFSQLFARSPIGPIQDHMKIAVATAEEMPAFIESLLAQNWEEANERYEKIASLESEADEIKRQVRSSLPRSIFMPVSRSDLLELLHAQDMIPNGCQDVAGLCVGRQMKFPVELQPKMKKFVACTLETVQAAGKALSELDELLESGFSGSEIELIENMIADLGRAEHETDQVQRDMQHTLFKFERDMNPIDVMFMYRIIESLGDIADYAQSVGNRMLYLIAK